MFLTAIATKLVIAYMTIHQLGTAVYELWPKYLTPETADQHAAYALLASTEEWPAERLLAIARVESHFDPTDTSRKDGMTGKRVTGKWRSRKRGSSFVGPYFCGVLQTKALSWSACLEQRDIGYGYRLGVWELTRWSTRYCKKNVRCALAGHGGGFAATKRVKHEAAHMNRAAWKGVKPKLKPPYWMRVLTREQTLRDQLASTVAVE